jgi:hypothetical protein
MAYLIENCCSQQIHVRETSRAMTQCTPKRRSPFLLRCLWPTAMHVMGATGEVDGVQRRMVARRRVAALDATGTPGALPARVELALVKAGVAV